MKFDRYIGIDPGKMGAISSASSSSVISVKMPGTVEEMNRYFEYLKEISECPIACVEKVNLWRSDNSDGRQFGIEKLVRNLNEVTTVLRIVKIPFIQVVPVQWQAYLSLLMRGIDTQERKRKYRDKAAKNFPAINVTLQNGDSLLIMQFLAWKSQREPEWVLKRLPESIIKSLQL